MLIVLVSGVGMLLIAMLVSGFFLVKSGALGGKDKKGEEEDSSEWGPDWCGGTTVLCALSIASLGLDAAELTKEVYDLAKWAKQALDEKKKEKLTQDLNNICKAYKFERM